MKKSDWKTVAICTVTTWANILLFGAGYKLTKYVEWRKQIKREEQESQERIDRWMETTKKV